MKQFIKFVFALLLSSALLPAQAQDVKALIQEGGQLDVAHNYAGAIDKYKAALALEPDNKLANYRIAFSLQAGGKGTEALPYLQKVVEDKAPAPVISTAYGLMGSIYDQAGQAQKAIESYKLGLKADSASYNLHYGLGLAYSRNHQYSEAETAAINAIRLGPEQSGAIRLYALATFHQNNRAAALLGFCRFLTMEPTGPQSAEANSNLRQILQGGVLKPEPGVLTSHHLDAGVNALNQAITQATAVPVKLGTDKVTVQLQNIFVAVGKLAEKQIGNKEFFKRMAAHYAELASSPQMPVLGRYVRQSVDQTAAAWVQANKRRVNFFEDLEKSFIQPHPLPPVIKAPN